MESRDVPPWRKQSAAAPPPNSQSSISKKRSAPVDAQEEAWVAEEDRFVLRQAKKKAILRVKSKRAKPIDWLAVALSTMDPTRNPFDEDEEGAETEVMDPEGVVEKLDQKQLEELVSDIGTYLSLDNDPKSQEYWTAMKLICKDRIEKYKAPAPSARGVTHVASDVDRLLGPKSYEQLEVLEKQIRGKLNSNESIDVDYWEHLLKSLQIWKARARLRKFSQAIVSSRLESLRKEQQGEANIVRNKLLSILDLGGSTASGQESEDKALDPEPFLRLRPEDKSLQSTSEDAFLKDIADERRRILKMGYVPAKQRKVEKPSAVIVPVVSLPTRPALDNSRFAATGDEDSSEAANALYQREIARGVMDNEEIFTNEQTVTTESEGKWSNKHRPRKPLYFNRVQMGYEWNKYNQTHYDHDNPPPKVVQGYKFDIFYPELIDKSKAPTYKIEREGGRKRGQSFAPAGEEDTCVIRFIAGPPYEDIAFRIIDKEWDYSAKRERGFRSTFDKSTLSLHFQFKKIYYRK